MTYPIADREALFTPGVVDELVHDLLLTDALTPRSETIDYEYIVHEDNVEYLVQQLIGLIGQVVDPFIADVWDNAYNSGVADAWQSMMYDHGQTPAARVNPYRPGFLEAMAEQKRSES